MSVKICAVVDDEKAKLIDEKAGELKVSRSQYLIKCLDQFMEDRGSYDVSTIVIELQYRTKQVEDMKDEINWLRGECSKLNNQFLLQSPPKLRWFWKR